MDKKAAKKAAKKTAARKTAARKTGGRAQTGARKSASRKAAKGARKTGGRRPNAAFMAPVTPDGSLAEVVGVVLVLTLAGQEDPERALGLVGIDVAILGAQGLPRDDHDVRPRLRTKDP